MQLKIISKVTEYKIFLIQTCFLPSSCWARNLNAAISAYVIPPRKKTNVTFCSAVVEFIEPIELPEKKLNVFNK